MAEDDTTSMEVDTPATTTTTTKRTKANPHVTPSASAETASKHPDMELAQKIHRLQMISSSKLSHEEASLPSNYADIVMSEIGGPEVENPSLYEHLKDTVVSAYVDNAGEEVTLLDDQTLTDMGIAHKKTLSELEKKVEEARESAGDMEVLSARFDVARFAAKSLSKEEALKAYEDIVALPKLSSGKTIDAIMESARVASFHGDTKTNTELVDKAVKMANDGGDWDRRNRLKVYNAISKLLGRDVKASASLFIDCIATFSCTELCSYTDFIVYTIITNILHLPRTEIKEKIVDGPEILSIVKDIPVVYKLVVALYECDYKTYLTTMVELQPILIADRFLQPHSGYLMRELHVLGYKQFLDSYKSVTLDSMASSFGVGPSFLDLQLSRFIAAGRLTAKIDKFGGVVETNRPDLKNAQYRDMIQHGDLLLNRIQKLARVVDL
eukprot:CAMPEP_0195521606 /NCGR_PEP_ID=MMETSP0794_2-20130614/19026_1 /TAXON_ID=515487 /ORGANISM="Stephanopyxis turris, Strain CCMP 815" /LENGTH=439 /DNA_ID=CAMNT_0040651191 /DNA_START=141 /DNA_END=1460 /DNA_ORIENTATION=+